jgi:hypothetical protein
MHQSALFCGHWPLVGVNQLAGFGRHKMVSSFGFILRHKDWKHQQAKYVPDSTRFQQRRHKCMQPESKLCLQVAVRQSRVASEKISEPDILLTSEFLH